LLLLRKYVNGGRITAIEQPELERVVLLSIAKRLRPRNLDSDELDADLETWDEDESGDLVRCELVVEIMDQRSNIVLVGDDNVILNAVRRVTPQMSRRPIMPREPYELPPPQEKRDPRHATAAGIAHLLETQPQPSGEVTGKGARAKPATLARAIVASYRGLSPLAAREAVFRATGDGDSMLQADLPWEQVATAVRAVVSPPWTPMLAEQNGEPQVFAAYALTSIPGAQAQPSMCAAVDAFYSARERLTDHQQRRDQLRAELLDTRERLDRQRSSLAGELERARDLGRLRWEGEMIFAYIHRVAPRQQELLVEDEEGRPYSITLDRSQSAVENAQERFRAYDKAKAAIEGVPERLRATELRIAGLDETLAMLAVADGFEAIETIGAEAAEQGLLNSRKAAHKGRKPGRAQSAPLRLESSDGLTIYVGRSAKQNEMVTFKLGTPGDLWLHVHDMPGAHVLIKSTGRDVPERTLHEAAGLAAYYSQARSERAIEIDFAPRSAVRRIRGGPPGLVSYHATGSLRAAPLAPW
jgi:predicted ribosome quality control (RQC) complex YloA/Tae2 family protein